MHEPDCIFCRILRQEIPAKVVAEDETSLVLMDINPLADGHIMVIPKSHAGCVHELSEAEAAGLFAMVRRVARPLREATKADALTIGINDGPAAGQVVPHVHVHIVPRREGDRGGHIHSLMREAASATGDLESIRAAIAVAVTSSDS